jgi:hypothetical protein
MTPQQAAILGGLIVWFAVLGYLLYHAHLNGDE